MSMDITAILSGVSFCVGFMAAHLLTKRDFERKAYERELQINNELGEAVKRQAALEKGYAEMASKIAALGDVPSTDAINGLYQEIRSKLSGNGQGKA